MVRLGIGASVLVSALLGIICLSIFRIDGMFTLIILGFTATCLTAPHERSYKAGGIAGIFLGFLVSVYGLFISPVMPLTPPNLPQSMISSLELSGIFTLILGLIFFMVICFIFGSLGGLIAQKIFKKKIRKPRTHVRKDVRGRGKNKAPRRTLNRNYRY